MVIRVESFLTNRSPNAPEILWLVGSILRLGTQLVLVGVRGLVWPLVGVSKRALDAVLYDRLSSCAQFAKYLL